MQAHTAAVAAQKVVVPAMRSKQRTRNGLRHVERNVLPEVIERRQQGATLGGVRRVVREHGKVAELLGGVERAVELVDAVLAGVDHPLGKLVASPLCLLGVACDLRQQDGGVGVHQEDVGVGHRGVVALQRGQRSFRVDLHLLEKLR